MYLYGEGERLSLTCIPRPFPCKMHIEKVSNSPNKQCDIPPEASAVVSIDRTGDMYSGGDMVSL